MKIVSTFLWDVCGHLGVWGVSNVLDGGDWLKSIFKKEDILWICSSQCTDSNEILIYSQHPLYTVNCLQQCPGGVCGEAEPLYQPLYFVSAVTITTHTVISPFWQQQLVIMPIKDQQWGCSWFWVKRAEIMFKSINRVHFSPFSEFVVSRLLPCGGR